MRHKGLLGQVRCLITRSCATCAASAISRSFLAAARHVYIYYICAARYRSRLQNIAYIYTRRDALMKAHFSLFDFYSLPLDGGKKNLSPCGAGYSTESSRSASPPKLFGVYFVNETSPRAREPRLSSLSIIKEERRGRRELARAVYKGERLDGFSGSASSAGEYTLCICIYL